ncbi:MAG TPA: acyl-CoA reductase, partial [Candidatus Baltobacteraceae bacterium]|nr:acyl-CoA reductase [Candidatus Baltobacteraceae bacterium]
MTHLQAVPARKIVRAIASAAQRWSDADFPPRVRLNDSIAERTGYALPVVEYALDRLFMQISERALLAVIDNELGSVDALDGFAARAGRPAAYAAPAGSVCVISSRTTIGVAIVPAIFALCAKCDVLVKDREDALVQAFFATLSEELDEFGCSVRASAWHGENDGGPAMEDFDVVVAFGRNDTLQHIARRVGMDARFIGYGSRASAGYIGREALRDEAAVKPIAAGAARDVVLYESEGCLSLHVLFIENGAAVTPERFCEMLASALEQAGVEFPLGRIDPTVTARVAAHRSLAAFRAASGSGAVYGDAHANYLVTLNPPANEPPSFLPRTLRVLPVAGPTDAQAYLRRHHLPLEGFALTNERADIVQMAISAGAVRLAPFGELQNPPIT